MLNKHINHVRSELESKYSNKENKIEFTHTHSYTCNNRLYHIFDFTDAKGKAKSLISGGYSDLGLDSDSALCELKFKLGEKMGKGEASAITHATARIETELMQRVKAPKKVSAKYDIGTYSSQIPTINNLLSDVPQGLSKNALERVEPFVIYMLLPNQIDAVKALSLFSDIYEEADPELNKTNTKQRDITFFKKRNSTQQHTILSAYLCDYKASYSRPDPSPLNGNLLNNLFPTLNANCEKLLGFMLRSDALYPLNEIKDLVKSFMLVCSQTKKEDIRGIIVNDELLSVQEFVRLGTELLENNHWSENFMTGIYEDHDECDEYDEYDEIVDDNGKPTGKMIYESTFSTTGLSALGFKDIELESIVKTKKDINLYNKILNKISDTFLNSGFILTKDAPLVVNLKDTLIQLEDQRGCLYVRDIRKLK